jgi:5'-nucleotidase (lipoprotein e(P4) family)
MPNDIHWVRNAAEKRAIYEMVFARATEAVEGFVEARRVGVLTGEASGRAPRVTEAGGSGGGSQGARPGRAPWAVILDADETVLDNSTYQVERSRQGLGYSSESWNAWVRREEATVLPGAMSFIQRVKALGGHVAIVTNRDISVCRETEANLATEGVPFDVVLCRGPETREKEVRFEMVQEGTTHAGLPPLEVLVWVGDNIEDFPGGTQALRGADAAALADFGRRFFVLPNPMYGSWEGNPRN